MPIEYRNILLIGAGGVGAPLSIHLGSVAASLTIVDHDIYERRNIARQPLAQDKDGVSKVDVLAEAITPFSRAQVVPICDKVTSDNIKELIERANADLIVSAVDNDEARKAIWSVHKDIPILWASNEVWQPQAGLSTPENPWDPAEFFEPAEDTEVTIACGQQTIHANLAAASLGSFLLMSHLIEGPQKFTFISKDHGEVPFYLNHEH